MSPTPFVDGNFELVLGSDIHDRIYDHYRYQWTHNAEKNIIGDFPLHLDIELNTNCNCKCPACFQSFNTPEQMHMPFEWVKKLIDEGKRWGLYAIKFNFRGEPLLSPILIKSIRYAKEQGIIDTMFNTNGLALTPALAAELVTAGLDKIIFSIDDHRKDVYERYRKGSNFSVVMNNLENLIQVRKYYHLYNPIIRVQKINRAESRHLNNEYIEFFKPYADHIAFHELLDYRCQESFDKMPNWCCASLWQRMLVLADGTICSCTGEKTDKIKLGHITKDNLYEIWNGPTMAAYRELHKKGESHKMEQCRKCALRLHYL